MSNRPSPDPRSSMWALIAWYLRICRQQWKQTGDMMGDLLECSKATVSRLETGDLRLDETRAALLDRKRNTGGIFTLLVWYAQLGHDPDWFKQYLDLEARASMIRQWQVGLVPGLLQTPDYARASLVAGGVKDVEAQLEKRLKRQEMFTREAPPELHVLLWEALLRIPMGGATVMRQQLAHLLTVSESSEIGLQVVPFAAGAHAGLDGAFMLLTLEDGDTGYVEAPEGGRLVSPSADVRSLEIRYIRIGQRALSEDQSRDLIREMMEAT